MVEAGVVGLVVLFSLGFVFGGLLCLVCVCTVANVRRCRGKRGRYSLDLVGRSERELAGFVTVGGVNDSYIVYA